MKKADFKNIESKLPDTSGIYLFKKGKEILYVGKATSLRDRVRSYFSSDLMGMRGPIIVKMVEEASSVDFKTTNSVLEALILEAFTIKKYQPVFNSKEKDDKSYNFVVITDEEFPRVLIERGRELGRADNSKLKVKSQKMRALFGPFPHGGQLKEALKIVRKIFPFRDKCSPPLTAISQKLKAGSRPCFNRQIGLCPGVCTGEISAKDYRKTIKNLELFFSGETQKLRKSLEKQMKSEAKSREFEKAEKTKRTIFALDHIQDVALLKNSLTTNSHKPVRPGHPGGLKDSFRIEAYDIAHISGTSTVGVMVVMRDGELSKGEYRKFKIRGDGKNKIDDIKNLREILVRRLGHAEWNLPNLIVVDGAMAQINIAKEVLKERNFNIDIVSVVKNEKHKPREILGKRGKIDRYSREILLINNEAHRFAIAFHKKKRSGQFLTKPKR